MLQEEWLSKDPCNPAPEVAASAQPIAGSQTLGKVTPLTLPYLPIGERDKAAEKNCPGANLLTSQAL